jgi:hypothetical protein
MGGGSGGGGGGGVMVIQLSVAFGRDYGLLNKLRLGRHPPRFLFLFLAEEYNLLGMAANNNWCSDLNSLTRWLVLELLVLAVSALEGAEGLGLIAASGIAGNIQVRRSVV